MDMEMKMVKPKKPSKRETKRMMRGMTASFISAIIDIAVFGVLVSLLPWGYWYIILATVIARLISTAINYRLVCNWCFTSTGNKRREMFFFFALAFTKMFVSANAVGWLATFFGEMDPVLAKAGVDIFLALTTYHVQNKYIFNPDSRLMNKH